MSNLIGHCAKCGRSVRMERDELSLFFLFRDGIFEKHDLCPSCTDIVNEWLMDEERGPIDAA